MSRSNKNNKSTVQKWFKRLQMRSQKQKQKESGRKLLVNPHGNGIRI